MEEFTPAGWAGGKEHIMSGVAGISPADWVIRVSDDIIAIIHLRRVVSRAKVVVN